MRPSIVVALACLLAGSASGQSPGEAAQTWAPWFPPGQLDPPAPPLVTATPSRGWWARADLLAWGVRRGPLDAVLAVDTSVPSRQMLGGGGYELGIFLGAQLRGGCHFDPESGFGVEIGAVFLEQNGFGRVIASDVTGTPPLARPLIDEATGRPVFAPISLPNVLTGRLELAAELRFDYQEVLLTADACRAGGWRLAGVGGYRHLSLEEELSVTQVSRGGQGTVFALPAGNNANEPVIRIRDTFGTRNDFHGGVVGARLTCEGDSCFLVLSAKGGLGVNLQQVRAFGETSVTDGVPAAGVVPLLVPVGSRSGAGVLVGPSNAGTRSRTQLSALGEAGVEAGVLLFPWMKAQIGYTGLFWTGVARPGDQIDTTINLNASGLGVGGPATGRPAPQSRQTDFWAHGFNVGLTLLF